MSNPWIFMGVDRSHFSAKLRPVLRYKKIYHVEYPPDQQRIADRTGTGFVPVLFSPEDEVFQDTTDIIDALEERFPDPKVIPAGSDGLVCRLFEVYADEFFPTVSMRTRWAYEENEQELRRAFSAFTGNLDLGNAVANLMSSYLPMLGVTEETIPAIDAHTNEILEALDNHLTEHSFVLGGRLSLADCALMGPLYAHLYLDRVTRKDLYDKYINVCMWIERCNRPVPENMGDWFNGSYPDSLKTILGIIGRDAAPLLSAMDESYQTWATANAVSGEEAPRGTGTYSGTLQNIPFSAGVRPYVSWKLQRLREFDPSGDAHALSDTGCEILLSRPGQMCELEKVNFKLLFKA